MPVELQQTIEWNKVSTEQQPFLSARASVPGYHSHREVNNGQAGAELRAGGRTLFQSVATDSKSLTVLH